MSPREPIEELIALLRGETRVLKKLHTAMVERRTAYVAMLPSTIARDLGPLEQLGQEAQALAQRRDALVTLLGEQLGLGRRLRVRRLLPLLPRDQRDRLGTAAAAATEAATAVRAEARTGERLLEFGRRCSEAMLRPALATGPNGATTYDRTARAVTRGAGGGRLITGVL